VRQIVFFLLVSSLVSFASAATDDNAAESRNLNLSMAGAVINDWCGRNWQASEFITVHACNYQLAQDYNFVTASSDFNACVEITGGDIVQIADCVLFRFNTWIEQTQGPEATAEPQG